MRSRQATPTSGLPSNFPRGAVDTHRVTTAEVDQIAAISNPVLRNLRITAAYHDLAVGMNELLGRVDANWCCFSVWASRTAGRFIRQEALPHIVSAVLAFAQRVPPRFRALTPAALTLAVRQAADNAALGNLIVFQDAGMLHARLLQAHAEEQDPGRAARRCKAMLRPGSVEDGGEDLLIGAVDAYHDAMLTTDPAKKAELILLANLRVGLHEQVRLQAPITQALVSPSVLRRTPIPLRRRLQTVWTNLATGYLMDIRFPAPDFEHTRALTQFSLGGDVRCTPSHDVFPPDLKRLHNLELKALMYDLDRTPNTVLGSAADDWSDLADRMNFIVDLFRAWQQEPSLSLPPFTSSQLKSIRAGHIPVCGPPL